MSYKKFFPTIILIFVFTISAMGEGFLTKPHLWSEGDTLVHSGYLTTYPRNGFSSDYDASNGDIYVGVVGYSSVNPDTCYLYQSTDNGINWDLYSWWADSPNEISNAQVVVGEGSNRYLFLAGRTDTDNGDIIVNRRPLPSGSWTSYTIGGSPRGIKNFTLTREQGSTYYLHLVYDSDSSNVFYMRSTNYGLNWTPYDTSDGDMPHLAVAGVDGLEDIFLTWRLDGPEGALYTSDDHGKVKKNKDFANNKWYLTPNMATSDTAFCIYQHEYSGRIYVGTGNSGDIYRSEDGGGSWSLMPDLSGAEFVYDIVGQNHTSNIVAATGEPARIFLWYMGVWQEKLELGAEDAFLCLAYDRTSGHFFAGSTRLRWDPLYW